MRTCIRRECNTRARREREFIIGFGLREDALPPSTESQHKFPSPDFEQQDHRFSAAFDLLRKAIHNQAFPGASVSVTHRGKLIAWKGLGRFTYDPESPEVSPTTIYDIASVTKVVAATVMAMILTDRGVLDIETPVTHILPGFATADARREHVSVRMLLAHSSGLPAYERLFTSHTSRDDLIHAALMMPLTADPGTRAEYSDIGFIVLGEVLSRVAGERIDSFCRREVFEPLHLSSTCYCPPAKWWTQIPPTRDASDFRGRVIQGEVGDENTSVMGGVSAHAGVFSNALDLAVFADWTLRGSGTLVKQDTIARFTTRETSPPGTSRALGWDTPSQPSQSGKYFSQRSYGHLGYTGASLWIDPERQISITLLTNRTWPTASNQAIKQVRPRVHDAIMEVILREGS